MGSKRGMVFVIVLSLVGMVSPLAGAADLVVTNVSDTASPGSLRWAMATANSNGEPDTITFDAGLTGQTIQLVGNLPVLTETGTTIDGTASYPADFDKDGDVDGRDLAALPDHGEDVSVEDFALQFGMSDGSAAPTIDGSGYWGSRGIRIENVSDITIRGLTLVGFQYGIQLDWTVSDVTIADNTVVIPSKYEYDDRVTIVYNVRTGAAGPTSQNIRFIANRVENGRFGIYVNDDHFSIHNIVMARNRLTGPMTAISLNTAYGPGARVSNVIISENTVTDVPDHPGISVLTSHAGAASDDCTLDQVTIYKNVVQDTGGIYVSIFGGSDSTIAGLIIEANRVVGSANEGINVDNETPAGDNTTIGLAGDPVLVMNNIVVGSQNEGIQCDGGVIAFVANNLSGGNRAGFAFTGSCNVVAWNNLAYKNDDGIDMQGDGEVELHNNLVSQNCAYGIRAGNSSPSLILSYNDVWGQMVDYLGVPSDPTDISMDPLFVDPENGDFHLQAGSPCIDAGNPDPDFNDPDGTRNDMGLYGGPAADELAFAVPPISYLAGIQRVAIANILLDPWLEAHFGGRYILNLNLQASACSVLSARAVSPSGAAYELSDDGVTNGDMTAGDGQFQHVVFLSTHPELGAWRFEMLDLDSVLYEAFVEVEQNLLFYPTLIEPGSTVASLTPMLAWNPVSGADDGYTIGIFDGLPPRYAPEGIVYMTAVAQGDGTLFVNVPPGVLESGKTYYWFVQADKRSDAGGGVYDAQAMTMWHFTTPSPE